MLPTSCDAQWNKFVIIPTGVEIEVALMCRGCATTNNGVGQFLGFS
jgi:hypothetical protein